MRQVSRYIASTVYKSPHILQTMLDQEFDWVLANYQLTSRMPTIVFFRSKPSKYRRDWNEEFEQWRTVGQS